VTERGSIPGRINRRRFLQISATAAAGAVLPALAAVSRPHLHVRRGVLLGAETELQLYHPDVLTAHTAIDACFSEVRRLETIFSLQRPDSALSRLNRAGSLSNPPVELVALLDTAAGFSRATGGAFDVTVQPLWELYARHFAAVTADPNGPALSDVQRALARVDYRQVEVSHALVAFNHVGMAVTLNGIAQGFITDRVTEMLRDRGFEHVLVNMGEMRALRGHADGTPWRVGIADPEQPWRSLHRLPLLDQAIATSGAYGMLFDADGRHHHLFDPHTGTSPLYYRSVSVIAPDATTADALSTGLSALAPEAALPVVNARREVRAILIGTDGKTWT
jgi:thiamine biosynthesis lipoprotein